MGITDIAAIIGMATGILGAIFGCCGFFHNRFLAVHQFLSGLHTEEAIKARKHVYETEADDICVGDEDASKIVNFYHQWGLLAKHKYLPLWVFNDGNREGVNRLYKKLTPYIEKMQEKNSDTTYAVGFKWLHEKLYTHEEDSCHEENSCHE